MKTLKRFVKRVYRTWALTPKQAEVLATIKFPCC